MQTYPFDLILRNLSIPKQYTDGWFELEETMGSRRGSPSRLVLSLSTR